MPTLDGNELEANQSIAWIMFKWKVFLLFDFFIPESKVLWCQTTVEEHGTAPGGSQQLRPQQDFQLGQDDVSKLVS